MWLIGVLLMTLWMVLVLFGWTFHGLSHLLAAGAVWTQLFRRPANLVGRAGSPR